METGDFQRHAASARIGVSKQRAQPHPCFTGSIPAPFPRDRKIVHLCARPHHNESRAGIQNPGCASKQTRSSSCTALLLAQPPPLLHRGCNRHHKKPAFAEIPIISHDKTKLNRFLIFYHVKLKSKYFSHKALHNYSTVIPRY